MVPSRRIHGFDRRQFMERTPVLHSKLPIMADRWQLYNLPGQLLTFADNMLFCTNLERWTEELLRTPHR